MCKPTHAAPHAPTPRRCLRIGALHLELVVALAIACTEVSGPCVLRWMWLQEYLRALDVCLQRYRPGLPIGLAVV